MLKRGWLQALCAVVCVVALTGCGDECVDQLDCINDKGNPPEGQAYACVDNRCELQDEPAPPGPDGGTDGGPQPTPDAGTDGGPQPTPDAGTDGGTNVTCTDSTTTGIDQGCSATSPLCDTEANGGQGACKACLNSDPGAGTDTGCADTAPYCDPVAGGGRGVCKVCQDSALGADTDQGCADTAPLCDPAANNGAGLCKACANSAQGADTDLGCADTAPLCDTGAGGGVGVCKACQDSAQGAATDLGCADTAPLCDPSAGNGAGACRACVDSAPGGATDFGCTATAPVCDPAAGNGAGVCRVCLDSAAGSGNDVGCASTTPLCDASAGNGAGACRVCMDTAGTGEDMGCTAPTSLCDASAGNGVGACKVCLSDQGCTDPLVCNAEGSACVGCVDDATCQSTPATPYCKAPPNVCVECVSNAQCTPTQPACDAETNACGCTTDAQCAATQGNTDFCDTAADNGRGDCKVCLTDAHCASVDATRPFCDNQTACIQCRTHADCALGETCNDSKACEAPPGPNPAGTSAQIQAFLNAAAGALNPALPIENAFITYIKPATGTDAAGFFLQAEPNGPAMFVEANPAGRQVGDRVSLSVSNKVVRSGVRTANGLAGEVTLVSQGHPVQNLSDATPPGLAVNHSTTAAAELVTQLPQYESELIRLTGTLASGSSTSGTDHVSFQLTTAGITSPSANFVLRLPAALMNQFNLAQGCQLTLQAGPMWRFNNAAQPSAYHASDLNIASCPAPKPVSVQTTSLTQLTLTFDRTIDPESVTNAAEQFTFTSGLTATAAQVNGKQVVLTTSTQTAGAEYTLTVASSVKDTLGTGVTAPDNTLTFKGYRTPAVLRITEVHANIASNVDLIELVAVSAGLVEGFVLQQDVVSPTTLATFPEVGVLAGDIIVVHLNPPASMTASETAAKNEFPKSSTPSNYDTAWDFKGGTTGIAYSSRVVLVKDALGTIQDAIPFASGSAPNSFPADLQAIQSAGLWLPANCGGAPCTGTSTPTAAQVSANWTGSATTPTGNSVRRISATDTDTRNDWAVGAQSFGAPNP